VRDHRASRRAAVTRARHFSIIYSILCSVLIVGGVFDAIHPMGWGHSMEKMLGLLALLGIGVVLYVGTSLALKRDR